MLFDLFGGCGVEAAVDALLQLLTPTGRKTLLRLYAGPASRLELTDERYGRTGYRQRTSNIREYGRELGIGVAVEHEPFSSEPSTYYLTYHGVRWMGPG